VAECAVSPQLYCGPVGSRSLRESDKFPTGRPARPEETEWTWDGEPAHADGLHGTDYTEAQHKMGLGSYPAALHSIVPDVFSSGRRQSRSRRRPDQQTRVDARLVWNRFRRIHPLSIQVVPEKWRDRHALRISNGLIDAVLLPGGGHLAELRLSSPQVPPLNCLWEAPWLTLDPQDPGRDELAAAYGGPAAGAFLAGYTGHAVCLDVFGMPSEGEISAGIPLHGEAASLEWQTKATEDGCACGVELPVAKLHFARRLSLNPSAGAVFIEEWVTSRGQTAREIHWVQHLTLGPPFLSHDCSSVHASLDHAITSPLGYEGHEMLRSNQTFAWPHAPSINNSFVDLEYPFQHPGSGLVAGARVDRKRSLSYIATLNWKLGIAMIYCFRRKDFPWVTIWEENRARTDPPWNGTAQVRGMEFGTTPLPLGREAMHRQGSLFETPVSVVLAPGESRRACYAIFIAAVPSHWRKITGVEAGKDTLTVVGPESGDRVQLAAEGLGDLLQR
jgi:hypothetical protein